MPPIFARLKEWALLILPLRPISTASRKRSSQDTSCLLVVVEITERHTADYFKGLAIPTLKVFFEVSKKFVLNFEKCPQIYVPIKKTFPKMKFFLKNFSSSFRNDWNISGQPICCE
jgi:hypothetical protein